ncbi:hypothetical protein ATCVMN08101_326L [Acanthocystis turfacea Chlorella virus MN0810.1]|nr:hypothetical protein ATCVMN08101_326L [Acanthocystis turfacea Chlorella virus MN0810.1]
MKTLEYYSYNGTHTVFSEYTIDEVGVVIDVKTRKVLKRRVNASGYNVVTLGNNLNRTIYVGRALASTFLGPLPTIHHTADHKDRNSLNDTLSNIRWLDKSGQSKNRTRPTYNKSAFLIIHNNAEHTAKEWAEILEKPTGGKFTADTISRYARRQLCGFQYKTFQNLRREVWKVVKGSNNSQGEYHISSRNRIKYKTPNAENVLSTDQLCRRNGYPVVVINGKIWACHELSLMTFRPNEYAAKLPGDIILHKNDDKLDFNPFHLRWGTHSDNRIDAHANGKYYNTKIARKPFA